MLPLWLLAATRYELITESKTALQILRKEHPSAKYYLDRAVALLVFPNVYKAGIGIGGEYGEGVLFEGGNVKAFYNIVTLSVGFQLGVQKKSIVLVFLDRRAYEKFLHSEGFKIGVDGSVAVIKWGVGEEVSNLNINKPIVAFVFNNKGLMYNLTLEGSKITRIEK